MRTMGPYQSGLWEISWSGDKTGASLSFLSITEHTISCGRADVAVRDYFHKGDYSNHLIPVLWGICSVKLYISISPDNCVQTRLHQYHYSLHCFTQTTHVWLMNRQRQYTAIILTNQLLMLRRPVLQISGNIVNHTLSMGRIGVSHSVCGCDNQH